MDFSSISSFCGSLGKDKKENNIFIIPGNPGVKHYYDVYTDALVESLKSKSSHPFKVTTISHKGHSTMPEIKNELHTVQDQIRFHKKFVTNHLEKQKDDKIILIGHSIGCYIILNMMKDEAIRSSVDKAIFLFPTIERMAESPKGQRMSVVLNNSFMRNFICLFAFICSFMPQFIRLWIAKLVIGRKVNQSMVNVTESITMKPNVLRQVLYMAHTEMLSVLQADHDTIKLCESQILFYYGHDDHWVPRSYYNEMVERYPHAQIYLSPQHMRHDFVLDSSKEMANITANWISQLWGKTVS